MPSEYRPIKPLLSFLIQIQKISLLPHETRILRWWRQWPKTAGADSSGRVPTRFSSLFSSVYSPFLGSVRWLYSASFTRGQPGSPCQIRYNCRGSVRSAIGAVINGQHVAVINGHHAAAAQLNTPPMGNPVPGTSRPVRGALCAGHTRHQAANGAVIARQRRGFYIETSDGDVLNRSTLATASSYFVFFSM